MKNPVKSSAYAGTSVLEDLSHAVRYNLFLENLLIRNTSEEERVLDFGAGLGLHAQKLTVFNRKVDCFEPDKTLAIRIRKDLGLKCFQRLEDLGCNYDAVYSINVLEHIEDDQSALDEMFARLRLGGTLLLFVPAMQMLYSEFDHSIGHHRRYSRKNLLGKVLKSGFSVRVVEFQDPVGGIGALFFKFLSRKATPSLRMILFFDRFLFPLSKGLQPVFRRLFGKNLLLLATKS